MTRQIDPYGAPRLAAYGHRLQPLAKSDSLSMGRVSNWRTLSLLEAIAGQVFRNAAECEIW